MVRRILLALALAAGAVAASAEPAQAGACSWGYTCDTVWYSDATRTTPVGGKREFCEGDTQGWGVRSGYQTWTSRAC
ncbi:DUF6289 family protein [Longispora sp. NPDC051575]|uniref:DUF6289 family protein n=1 Tax=Longispora sp. NPDC051575 TaxID=3154943 RepID=UPI0034215C68